MNQNQPNGSGEGGGLSMDTGLKCCIYGCVLVYQIYEINKYKQVNEKVHSNYGYNM